MNSERFNSNSVKSTTHRDQLLTLGDLETFKSQLLLDINNLLSQNRGQAVKQWLRSSEVRKMLGISAGTLQNLRINGTLSYGKIGGIVYYKYDDIINLLDHNSEQNKGNG